MKASSPPAASTSAGGKWPLRRRCRISSEACNPRPAEFLGNAVDVQESLIDQQDPHVGRGNGDPLGDVGQDALQLGRAFGQGLLQPAFLVAQGELGALAFGDVGAHADETARACVLLLYQIPAAVGPGVFADRGFLAHSVGDEVADELCAVAPDTGVGHDIVGDRGFHQILHRFADDLLLCRQEGEDFVKAAIGQDDLQVRIVEHETVREVVDRLAQHHFRATHLHLFGHIAQRNQDRRFALPEDALFRRLDPKGLARTGQAAQHKRRSGVGLRQDLMVAPERTAVRLDRQEGQQGRLGQEVGAAVEADAPGTGLVGVERLEVAVHKHAVGNAFDQRLEIGLPTGFAGSRVVRGVHRRRRAVDHQPVAALSVAVVERADIDKRAIAVGEALARQILLAPAAGQAEGLVGAQEGRIRTVLRRSCERHRALEGFQSDIEASREALD